MPVGIARQNPVHVAFVDDSGSVYSFGGPPVPIRFMWFTRLSITSHARTAIVGGQGQAVRAGRVDLPPC